MELSVREVAELLRVSERQIYAWIKDLALPAHRVNQKYRVHRAELLEWATSRNLDVPADLFQPDEPAAGTAPTLADALEAGGISRDVAGADKTSVLQSVVSALRLPPELDRDFLLRVLLAREALGSTGIGEGIAIPHPRNPIVLQVDRPAIGLCFLSSAIDFRAVDGKPVHTLFSLISPTARDHLHLLSRLAFALRHPVFKAAIVRRAADDEILRAARLVEENLPRPFDKRVRKVA